MKTKQLAQYSPTIAECVADDSSPAMEMSCQLSFHVPKAIIIMTRRRRVNLIRIVLACHRILNTVWQAKIPCYRALANFCDVVFNAPKYTRNYMFLLV